MAADPILIPSLPIALDIIMLSLGLFLTPASLLRVVRYPKPVLVGLVCQIALLPVARPPVVQGFTLGTVLAVGIMLLAASPGSATTNPYGHLAHDDVALNITLTVVNSVTTIPTIPLIVDLPLQHFMDDGQAIPLQLGKVMQMFAIVLGPVIIGMLVRSRLSTVADRLQKPVKILSALLLLVITLLTLAKDRQTSITYAPVVELVVLVFNLLSLTVGCWVPRLLRLSETQTVAIDMEISIHNGTLTIALTLSPSLLNNSTMAILPVIYGVLMFFTVTAFGWWVSRGHQIMPAPVTAPD